MLTVKAGGDAAAEVSIGAKFQHLQVRGTEAASAHLGYGYAGGAGQVAHSSRTTAFARPKLARLLLRDWKRLEFIEKIPPCCSRPAQRENAMTEEIEPLAPALWFDRIEMIARGELSSVENALRHAAHLLQLAPMPFRHLVRQSLADDVFEALLEAGELDTAARHLVAQPTALTVHEDPDGPVRAVISCAVSKRAIHGTGDSAATAVLNAWTTCLLALRTEFGADLLSLADQPWDIGQSARHRQSS